MDEYDNFPPLVLQNDGSVLHDKSTAPQNIEVEVIEKEDDILKFTQKARQQLVKSLMSKNIEDLNASQISLLTSSLDGMDRSALGRKRLQTDEAVGASNAMAAAIIARVLATPGAMTVGQGDGTERRAIPTLPTEVPDPVVVPGEMESGAAQMSYDTFMAQSSTSAGG
jgi:hypothetical protein